MFEFRLAISLSGLETKRFDTILSNIILSVCDSDEQYRTSQIQELLSKTYNLSFTSEEIIKSLTNTKFCTRFDQNGVSLFKFDKKAIEKLKRKNNSFSFDKFVQMFILENQESLFFVGEQLIIISKVEDILKSFFYNIFNNEKTELLSLLTGNNKNDISLKKFSVYERNVIRLFLDWKDEEKDRFVFDVVKSAFDYCALTLKTDADSSLFSDKNFYLDTNVIFSLNGVNGPEKEYSTTKFVEKCKSSRIKLICTSVTYLECQNTIKNLVDNMANLIKKDSFLSYDDLKRIFPSSNPASLYQKYTNWMNGHPSRNGDYEAFKEHLLLELEKTIETINYYAIPNSIFENNESTIQSIADKITSFKENLGRKHNRNSAICDAKNYFYIDSLRNKNAISMKNEKNFFVTFDTGMHSWAAKQYDGLPNVFTLLNIIYGIMLRFGGRSKDDYRSFNDFISYRFSDSFIDESEYKAKEEIIEAIDQLDVPSDGKQKMVYIANKLLEDRMNSETSKEIDVEEIVKTTQDNFYEQHEKYFAEENKKNASKAKQEGIDEGKQKVIERLVDETIQKKKLTVSILFWIFILALIVIAIIVFIVEKTINSVTGWILAILGLSGFLSIIPFVRNKLLAVFVNENKISEKINKKFKD